MSELLRREWYFFEGVPLKSLGIGIFLLLTKSPVEPPEGSKKFQPKLRYYIIIL